MLTREEMVNNYIGLEKKTLGMGKEGDVIARGEILF